MVGAEPSMVNGPPVAGSSLLRLTGQPEHIPEAGLLRSFQSRRIRFRPEPAV